MLTEKAESSVAKSKTFVSFFFSFLIALIGIQFALIAIKFALGFQNVENPPFFFSYDRFMDFFNINQLSLFDDRYTTYRAIYTPFNFLIAKLFVVFPSTYLNGAAAAKATITGQASLFIFLTTAVSTALWLVKNTFERLQNCFPEENSTLINMAIFAFFLLNLPFLYALDRGNYIIIAFAILTAALSLERKPFLFEVLIACLLSMKIYFLLLMPLFLEKGKFKSGVRVVIWFITLNLLSMIITSDYLGYQIFWNALKFGNYMPLIEQLASSISLNNLFVVPIRLFLHISWTSYNYIAIALPCYMILVFYLTQLKVPFWFKLFTSLTVLTCLPPAAFVYNLILIIPFIPHLLQLSNFKTGRVVLGILALALSPWNTLNLYRAPLGYPNQAYLITVTEQSLITPLAILAMAVIIVLNRKEFEDHLMRT